MKHAHCARLLARIACIIWLVVASPLNAQHDPSGAWIIVEPSHTAPGGDTLPEHTWTLVIAKTGGRYTATSGDDEAAGWDIDVRNWDFVLSRPWLFRGDAPEGVKGDWNARQERHDVRLAVGESRSTLSGQRRGYRLWWNADGQITRLEPYKIDMEGKRAPPPTPADLYEYFLDLQAMLQVMAEAFRSMPDYGFDVPADALRVVEYRLALVSRYLRIHELFENQALLEHPGPADKLKPGPRQLDEEDLFLIANAYTGLLQEPAPSQTGTFWTGVKWRDARGAPLYFDTQHEGEVVRSVLTYAAIDDQRERVRRRLMIAAELTIGTTNLLPGGAIPELTMVALAGRAVYGNQVGFLGRVLAVAGLGLELMPVAIPAVGAGLAASARRLPRGTQRELIRYLAEKDGLRARIAAAEGRAVPREAIQADWLRHQDALLDRRTSGIPISRETVAADGIPSPARGIDHYAYPRDLSAKGMGIVRELKLKQEFSNTWTRSETSLNKVSPRSLGAPVRQAIDQAGGAATVDQLSWPWILDRAIKGHRLALKNGSAVETVAARDLIQRFARGNLTRQLCIMTDAGEVFARASTMTGPRAGGLSSAIDDIVPVAELQAIARAYLGSLDR